jgi:hypothetical protein
MSTKLIWATRTIVLWSVLAAPAPAQSPVTRPAQIIVIRHAEKPPDEEDPHLSRAGVKRAEQLVSFITTDPAMIRFGPPVAVFATQTTMRGPGQRTQETVAPYAGKTVLICWNHEEIPSLVAALGVPEPPKWKASVFDLVYVISYRGGTAAMATSRYGSR